MVPANEDAPVGIVASPSLDDLAAIMPDVAHSLREVLDYRGMYVCFPLLIFRSEMFPSQGRYHLTTICLIDANYHEKGDFLCRVVTVEELFAYIFGIYIKFGNNNPSILAPTDLVDVAT